ncbi:MAG: AI-2E family transporter [Pseudolabrys sp.]|nr:AI-2E family transporter [Pseudolabrys sp.]MDP2298472.1 AI-2E family transporter [Pseudolabrys sp.]
MDTRQVVKQGAKERVSPQADDAAPAVYDPSGWSTASQVSLCGIFLIVFIAALELARPLLLPATCAVVIGLMLGPLQARTKVAGLPPLVTAIALWLLVVIIFYGMIALLAAPAVDWIGKAPEIGATIKEKFQYFNRPLQAMQDLRNAIQPEHERTGLGIDIVNFVTPALTFVTPAIGQIMIFFGTLFFFLLGRARLRSALVAQFDDKKRRLRALRIMNAMERSLTGYLSVVAVINLAVGVAATVIAFAVGLPNPVAWGVLGFLLNFIPYLGALIMQVVLLAVGLVTFPTLTHAVIAPLAYLAFTTLEGHFITPGIMGRQLTLMPLTVFLSLIFWTWLWGPVGAFLAVPLLIVSMVALQHIFPSDEPDLPG